MWLHWAGRGAAGPATTWTTKRGQTEHMSSPNRVAIYIIFFIKPLNAQWRWQVQWATGEGWIEETMYPMYGKRCCPLKHKSSISSPDGTISSWSSVTIICCDDKLKRKNTNALLYFFLPFSLYTFRGCMPLIWAHKTQGLVCWIVKVLVKKWWKPLPERGCTARCVQSWGHAEKWHLYQVSSHLENTAGHKFQRQNFCMYP